MDSKNSKKRSREINSVIGWVYFTLFATLIIAGIVVKRVFGHPEFMTLFHLPAAVFLVLAGYELTKKSRAKYRRNVEEWKRKRAS